MAVLKIAEFLPLKFVHPILDLCTRGDTLHRGWGGGGAGLPLSLQGLLLWWWVTATCSERLVFFFLQKCSSTLEV